MGNLRPVLINLVEQLIISFTRMQSLLLISFVVFVAVYEAASGKDDCSAKVFNGGDCCNILGITPEFKKESIDKCVQKYLRGHPPQTSSKVSIN